MMRRIIPVLGAAALAVAGVAAPATAEPTPFPGPGPEQQVVKSKIDSYVVVMKANPLVSTIEPDQLDTARARSARTALVRGQNAALSRAGVPIQRKVSEYANALNGFAVTTDLAGAKRLAKDPTVAVVLPDELRKKAAHTGSAASTAGEPGSTGSLYDWLGLTQRGEAWRSGVTGEGVIVGVIDTGIWPEHPSFADDGSYPAAPTLDESKRSACDFGNTEHNANDKAFTCNDKLIGARAFLDTYKRQQGGLTPDEFDSARDDDGHGTHTASTSAGNKDVPSQVLGVPKGKTSGIAPRARVIAYKALGDGGGYTSDLVAAIDQAVADGVDVINYSIGGGASTVSPDTLAFLFAADAGVYSAVSAGNDGPGEATVGGPADVPWVTAVGANTHPVFYRGELRLSDGSVWPGASVTRGSARAPMIDAARAGNELCLADSLDPAQVRGKIVLCKRGGNGRVAKSHEVQRAGGVGMILFNAVDVDTLFTDTFFVPTVMMDYTPGERLRARVNATPSLTGQIVNRGVGQAPFYSPSMAYFSSRGENPTAGDIIKPDITAPGVQIMAGTTPFPTPGDAPPGESFMAIAGTSMSSPVVAGSYALLKQAHRDWSPAMAKSALMTTAYTDVRDNDRRTQAGPFAMGSGMALLGEPAQRGSSFKPGLVYDAGFNDYLGFLCEEGREAFANADATCASLKNAGFATTAENLNYPSIGVEAVPGTQTVTRTVTSVADRTVTYTARVRPPTGYRVQVSPSSFEIAPGETKTFTVTLTSTTRVRHGQWSTNGSLDWRGGGFAVRSPIAVKSVPIQAPASVTETGTSGSATIPVTFGFSGQYTAVTQGLAAPQGHNGTISQDPDRTFPSPDDGAGVVRIPYTLSGASAARWTLTRPGDDDLDLFLLDSAGRLVAASTNGGTNEQIDLTNPADGNYTLVVHGWAVSAPNTPFTVNSWVVSPSGGVGDFRVTSGSPARAVLGASHEVEVAWSGLTAGTRYLGVVKHRNGDTVVGQTLVQVDG